MKSNSNLPPGVTNADIDRAAGCYPEECVGCEDVFEANELNEKGLCENCAEEKEKNEK